MDQPSKFEILVPLGGTKSLTGGFDNIFRGR